MPHRFCTLPYMNQLRKDPARVFLLSYPHRFPRLPPAPRPRPRHTAPHRQDAGNLSQQKQGTGRGLCAESYRADSSGELGYSRAFVLSPNLGRMPAAPGPERQPPSGFFLAPASATRCRGNPHLAHGVAGSCAVVHVLDDPVAFASRCFDSCGSPGECRGGVHVRPVLANARTAPQDRSMIAAHPIIWKTPSCAPTVNISFWA